MSTTEQVQNSRDKKIIQDISFKDFSAISQEYQGVETSFRKLISIRDNPDTPLKVQVDVCKWIIEMNIGKPKQINDVAINKGVTLEEVLAQFSDPDDPYCDVEDKGLGYDKQDNL
jgi:hypothetical protein